MKLVGTWIILAALAGSPNAIGGQLPVGISGARESPAGQVEQTGLPSQSGLPSTVIYACDFSDGSDANFDGWPDGWSRRRGPGFPPYLKVGIVPTDPESPRGPRHLQMNLDGGAVQINSPLLPITPDFEYLLELSLRTTDLVNNSAYVTLAFHDENRKPIELLTSTRFTLQEEWKTVRLGPHLPARGEPKYVSVGFHLAPGTKRDLFGSAMFANMRVSKVPRLKLLTNRRSGVYLLGEEIEISCSASGLGDSLRSR